MRSGEENPFGERSARYRSASSALSRAACRARSNDHSESQMVPPEVADVPPNK
jgi:hypothetical protein